MSEGNEGGFAERGNVVGSAGGLTQPGGPNTSSGGTGSGSGSGSSGTQSQNWNNPGRPITNFNSVWSPNTLNPGVRLGVPSFSPFAGAYGFGVPRKDQSTQDINNAIGAANAAAAAQAQSGSNHFGSQPQVTYQTVKRKNKKTGVVETVTIPVPRPKPPSPNFPATGPIPKPGYISYQDWVENLPASQPPREDYGTWTGPYPQSAYEPNWQNITDPTLPTNFPTGNIRGSSTAGGGLAGTGGVLPGQTLGPDWPGLGGLGNIGGNSPPAHSNHPGPGMSTGGRQFGGPVAPGGQYTVGENGPETLQMGATGGQVIPNNPVDRLGGINPQLMQQLFQLQLQQQQRGGFQGRSATPNLGGGPHPGGPYADRFQYGGFQGRPATPNLGGGPHPGGPYADRFQYGGFQGQPRATTAVARPATGGGFGLSSLGMPGVLGQLRNRGG